MITKVSKEIFRKLKRLYFINPSRRAYPTINEAQEILMTERDIYVAPFPRPYYKWTAVAFLLGRPHADGKLILFNGYPEDFASRKDAVLYAMNDTLDQIIEAKEMARKMSTKELREHADMAERKIFGTE